jgi:hypothetical protein
MNYLVKGINNIIYNILLMIIHCIGDSHTWQFINKLPANLNINENIIGYKNKYNTTVVFNNNNITFFGYRCCEDGAYAYNIEKRQNIIDNIVFNTTQNDVLMFMFGEVDCRYKIKSQMLKNNTTIEDEVLIVVNRYIDFIRKYNNRQIIIWGPHPQHTSPTHHYIDCFDSAERNAITKVFNEKLEFAANKENYIFITLFDNLIDKSNLNNYFLDDTIHIKPCKEVFDIYMNKIIKS